MLTRIVIVAVVIAKNDPIEDSTTVLASFVIYFLFRIYIWVCTFSYFKVLNTENSNVVETLKYTSQDLIGNTYVIDAESAKFERDGKENIILFKVYAEIIRQDTETIKIYSDTANYNK